jgi:hypothetical protein
MFNLTVIIEDNGRVQALPHIKQALVDAGFNVVLHEDEKCIILRGSKDDYRPGIKVEPIAPVSFIQSLEKR